MAAATCAAWSWLIGQQCRSTLSMLDVIVSPVLGLGLLALLLLEQRYALRRRTQPLIGRVMTNAGVACPAMMIMRGALLPLVLGMAIWVDAARFGVTHAIPLFPGARGAVAFVLMDYTTYLWHRLNHTVPIFWRFHRVHHTDLDLDVSTAFRFHFGEMLWSLAARTIQVGVIGVPPIAALVWEGAEFAATLFHHSNLRLPVAVERVLNVVIVTPRMHGIHHSIIERETNANWSVLCSAWDRLHGSLRLDVPQAELVMGLPAHRDLRELRLVALLLMPFRAQAPAWRLPSGGHPDRGIIGDTRRLTA